MTTPDDAPTAAVPPVPPPPPPPVDPPPSAGMASAEPPSAGPWIAPPRQLWINPQKRTPVILSAVAAGVVLLGGGVLIGVAIGHDHNDRVVRVVPGDGFQRPFRDGQVPGPGQFRQRHQPQPSISVTPTK